MVEYIEITITGNDGRHIKIRGDNVMRELKHAKLLYHTKVQRKCNYLEKCAYSD